MPHFVEYPYYVRPDLTPYLIHLTKGDPESGITARDRLLQILRDGIIRGSDPDTGHIKGAHPAVCLMDVPFMALKYVLSDANVKRGRYEPYGLVISKTWAYGSGARPALYLSRDETRDLIPQDEHWRVVHFDGSDPEDWQGWLHEREWRLKGDLKLPSPHGFTGVLVKSPSECRAIHEASEDDEFPIPSRPRAVIPIQVICQGLPYLDSDDIDRFA